jgi:hypothetical protein
MALPSRTTGSLCPTFVPASPVGVAVKLPYAIALYARLPSVLREPLKASDTLSEATTPVKLPAMQCPLHRELDVRIRKGGISPSAPFQLAPELHCLPPILHILIQTSVQSCSKGAWGLSVPWQVISVFTDTTISPGSWPRQWSDRYTIRAGRNLPDKEFRYLRTVIVTAAVYWGFSSELRPHGLTPPFNLPAPGRCQAIYFNFRFSIALCFC